MAKISSNKCTTIVKVPVDRLQEDLNQLNVTMAEKAENCHQKQLQCEDIKKGNRIVQINLKDIESKPQDDNARKESVPKSQIQTRRGN